jgi:hypothetical protein
MEAASVNIFLTSSLKFQVADTDLYYVHHMSMYEHMVHMREGYEIAQNKTSILSNAALKGECEGLNISGSLEYLALIPFYGGRPPNVTTDLKVKSIGQGNSLVRLIAICLLICLLLLLLLCCCCCCYHCCCCCCCCCCVVVVVAIIAAASAAAVVMMMVLLQLLQDIVSIRLVYFISASFHHA